MRMVWVSYEYDSDARTWSADTDVPGFMAVAKTKEELRQLVREGVPFFLERDDVIVVEKGPLVPLTVHLQSAAGCNQAQQFRRLRTIVHDPVAAAANPLSVG